MRGPYHQALLDFLLSKWAERTFTQESLARAMGKDQTSVGKYLKGTAGTLDLDDADAALAHAGTSLRAFIADPARPVARPLPKLSSVAKALAEETAVMDDRQRALVLAIVRSLRTHDRQTRRQSAQPRVADRVRTVRKIGGKR